MRFSSTRGTAPEVELTTALLAGGAPDGGLYLPDSLPRIGSASLERLRHASLPEVTSAVLAPFFEGVLRPRELLSVAREALDFPLPSNPLEEGLELLELFHGPTLAFKDFAARMLARLLPHLPGAPSPATVLVATSGDTGAAAAAAFHGVDGVRVVVLYPRGRVSPLQERQLATLGGNVTALAVEGTFDDCQSLVRRAHGDRKIRRAAGLVAANSLGLGRLLPQIAYYFWAASRSALRRPLFCVPSGNLGNLTAGLLARRMGLQVAGFIAATNVNDLLARLLRDGSSETRPTRRTLATAMDVGRPSNLERILALYDGDRAALARDVAASAHADDRIRQVIREVHDRTGSALDPHTAVGYAALSDLRAAGRGRPAILLATAHPAKFPEIVEPLIGRPLVLPPGLARTLERPLLAEPMAPDFDHLRRVLDR